ncbi:RNA-directed DNA polymerase, eukaryota, reverse transcriptase zinc-binding domain protein [Tanacetum coccineum]|uniref:RNA-directed DNA polymerase, eukaryota, reverse transcriptase zinc-binding domain protein n=1 Tax=Tanacetum coccineum TaxID=301880 RepID=A0ABQ5GHF2_9ASTR
MRDSRSKEDDVLKISTSIFVTNFPEKFSAKDLWEACSQYGKVIDSYIPNRRTKSGMRFGFVRFIKTHDVERLINNLCTIWIGSFKIHANIAKFQRLRFNKNDSQSSKQPQNTLNPKEVRNDSGRNWNSYSYANVVQTGSQHHVVKEDKPAIMYICFSRKRVCIKTKIQENILETLKIIIQGKVFWIRANEAYGWVPDFVEDEESDCHTDEEESDGELQENNKKSRNLATMEGDSDVEEVPNTVFEQTQPQDHQEDPKDNQSDIHSEDPFNLYDILNKKKPSNSGCTSPDENPKYPPGFTPLVSVDTFLKNAGEMNGKKEIHDKGAQKENLSATNSKEVREESVCSGHFKHTEIPRSGGSILQVMDDLVKMNLMSLNIQGLAQKAKKDWVKELCIKNKSFSGQFGSMDAQCGDVIIMGDFNEVRREEERRGSTFNVRGANFFNSFIANAGLEEVPLGGSPFTWSHKSGAKMSKLDRFLISEGLLTTYPGLSAVPLDRYLSDHRPILLREAHVNYGPIKKDKDRSQKKNLKDELAAIDAFLDKGEGTSTTRETRSFVLNSVNDLDKLEAIELAQKAKIKWAIEGDENSKYYHGILNKKRNQLAIRGILADGVWVENPDDVKNEFLSHFSNRFDLPESPRIQLDMDFPNVLSPEQQADLECNVSRDEVKRAVWDCGVDKSPGPDGFTFGFYRRYWSLIENDVVAAVCHFFQHGDFPKGGNPCFISLIPKVHDANMVKDFRPITLIRSVYKIISKILANRLVGTLGNLVNEVQSAFVANRQILDGSFIINELVQWCKRKKKHSMIFKVDFEKAYDSVRWDYMNDVLSKIGSATIKTPFSYLGSTIGGNMSQIKSWEEIIKKVETQLSKWKLKTLSIGGRLTLLKSVLGSIPIYHMSLFKVPKTVLRRLEAIMCRFLHGNDNTSRKPTWLNWNKVLASNQKGGLGVSSFFALNRALIFKWVWRFRSQNSSLWAKVIKSIHGIDGKLDSTAGHHQSLIWVDIVREVHALKRLGIDLADFIRRKVGDGEIYALASCKTDSVASMLSRDLFSQSFRRAPRGGEEQSQLNALLSDIEDVQLANLSDRWIWTLEGSGEFSVASIRRLIDKHLLPDVASKTRWLTEVPIKINIHAWKVKLDGLPSRLNISKRGISIDSILCPSCELAVESSSHTFFQCKIATDLFRLITQWWDVSFVDLSSYEEALGVVTAHWRHSDVVWRHVTPSKSDSSGRMTITIVTTPVNVIGAPVTNMEIGKSSRIDDEVVQDQRQRDDNDLQDESKINPRKKRLILEEERG